MINRNQDEIKIQGLEEALDKCHSKVARLEAVAKLLKKKGGKRKTRRKKHRGGAVSLDFPKPEVSNTSAGGAVQGAMNKQKLGNEELVKLNKELAGGGKNVVVPQMNQAGEAGNKTITGGVQNTLQGSADAEYDNRVYDKPASDGMPGGGRRRRKRKTKRKSRKSKRKRRRRRKTKRKRKSKRRRR